MSTRAISVPPSQGQAFGPRSGSQNSKPLQTLGDILFLKRAGTFSCGRLVAKQSRCQLHDTLTSQWSANYPEPPADVRNRGLGLELVFGEGIASSSSYAQSSDVRAPVNGNSRHGVQDAATRNGCREDVSARVFDVALESQAARLDDNDLDCYVPVLGDRVVGVVISGNYSKLDVDIGAAKLGHLHVHDLLPNDKFDIYGSKCILPEDASDGGSFGTPLLGSPHVLYDEQVYSFGAPQPLVVDIGTVLELEVVGQTVSGNPLLSARKAAQRLQWDRVMQIKERNEPFQVKILNFNKSGLIATVEGLRAFLPLAEFIRYPNAGKGEGYESYVGRKLWVTIAYVRESRGNITLSEKEVWMKRNIKLGSVLDGTVTKIYGFGALVQVNETDIWGMIHISNIADGRINQVSDVFEVGEQVKVIVVKSPIPDRLAFSTALLESEPGLMLRDKERVFREAEQTAIALCDEHPEWKQPIDDGAKNDAENDAEDEAETFSKPISNLEWVKFQQRTHRRQMFFEFRKYIHNIIDPF